MSEKKEFLISIDTEGDNQWDWSLGDQVKTENAKYLPRFQSLCEKFGFKPTFLTNYEMANDLFFINYFGKKQEEGLCEIGMHLHAWNCPPDYRLSVRKDVTPGAPYLIEYPLEIMEEKIKFMTNLIKSRFGIDPIVHRAGRWAMNETYYQLLVKYGYKVDCSATPGVNWQKAMGQSPNSIGTDYTDVSCYPYYVSQGILEVPMTIRENHRLQSNPGEGIRKWIRNHWNAFRGTGKIWLRPNGRNLQDMLWLVDLIQEDKKDDYLMFMIHSSELMQGGKSTFKTSESIDQLFCDIERLFEHISLNFKGTDFSEYEKKHRVASHDK